jgi:hypothetical protein
MCNLVVLLTLLHIIPAIPRWSLYMGYSQSLWWSSYFLVMILSCFCQFFGFAGTGRMVTLQSVVVECFHSNMSWIYFHDSVDRVVVLLVGCQQTNRDYIKLPLS